MSLYKSVIWLKSNTLPENSGYLVIRDCKQN